MSLFKEKKVRLDTNASQCLTIDAKHTQYLNQFSKTHDRLSKDQETLSQLQVKLSILSKQSKKEMTDTDLTLYFKLQEQIDELHEHIKSTTGHEGEKAYTLDTAHLMFHYYDKFKNNSVYQHVPKISNKKQPPSNLIQHPKSVLDFFSTPLSGTASNAGESDKCTKRVYSKSEIINSYMKKVDDTFIYPFENDNSLQFCEFCNQEKTVIASEGIIVCTACGRQDSIIIDSDKPSYKDPPREISYFAYKRINHFNEWLAQFQAKESTEIAPEVFDKIMVEIKKERIRNMASLSPSKLREILKKLRLNKYYEHVPHIINRLNGLPAPVMTRETEEKLRMMFKEIQTPFLKHCPKERKNFLSYSYVLHKFVQLLEMDEFLVCFPLLKSREKLHQQDQIWKKICEELQWEFIKSL
jgi:hypothetical protein